MFIFRFGKINKESAELAIFKAVCTQIYLKILREMLLILQQLNHEEDAIFYFIYISNLA
jgi:hypothetical protein